MAKGKCLCGAIQFEITGSLNNLYQCHCSLCRQVTGSAANTATFVAEPDFVWLKGEQHIRSFVKDSGYRNDFCSQCGSSVPNKLRDTAYYWVPAGLLESSEELKVVAHLYTDSKAQWDQIGGSATQYQTMPSLNELHQQLENTEK